MSYFMLINFTSIKKTVSLLFLVFIAHFSLAQKVFNEQAFRGDMDRYFKSPAGFLQSEATPDFVFTGADDKPQNLQRTKAIYDLIIETDRIFSNVNIRQNGATAVVTGDLVQKIKTLNQETKVSRIQPLLMFLLK